MSSTFTFVTLSVFQWQYLCTPGQVRIWTQEMYFLHCCHDTLLKWKEPLLVYSRSEIMLPKCSIFFHKILSYSYFWIRFLMRQNKIKYKPTTEHTNVTFKKNSKHSIYLLIKSFFLLLFFNLTLFGRYFVCISCMYFILFYFSSWVWLLNIKGLFFSQCVHTNRLAFSCH